MRTDRMEPVSIDLSVGATNYVGTGELLGLKTPDGFGGLQKIHRVNKKLREKNTLLERINDGKENKTS